jgi:predicted ATPase/DNA-binding CsgD family transcriptional regulator
MPREMRNDSLPHDLTSFIGRDGELVELRHLLTISRLLTVSGPGGIGKTRLALRLAAEAAGREASAHWPDAIAADGVWIASLAALVDSSLVPAAVAVALGVTEQPRRGLVDTLSDFLRPRRGLLVLDNCEHVVAACAGLAENLLSACPGLTILATSRERLGVPGEVVWHIAPLTASDSVRLFGQRAKTAMPAFCMTSANAEAVAANCRRLDGIPLAIELAAGRVGVLTIHELAKRLHDAGGPLGVLTAGARTTPARHRTLRATIDWSYDLLPASGRVMFAQLAVFAGDWTLDAAEAVCGGDGIVDRLAELVDRSLVRAQPGPDGPARYRLLEPLRQYGAERLAGRDDRDQIAARHSRFFVLFGEHAERELVGPDQIAWLRRVELEHDNIRAALAWLLAHRDAEAALRLSGALWRFWRARDHLTEGREWLERALAADSSGATISAQPRARALFAAGTIALFQGDAKAAREWLAASVDLYAEAGDARGRALSLIGLATPLVTEDRALACSWLSDSLATARAAGDVWLEAAALFGVGHLERAVRDHDQARGLYEQSLSLFRSVGERLFIEFGLANLGYIALQQGDGFRAASLLDELLAAALERGNRYMAMSALFGLGLALVKQRCFAHAARVLGAVEALYGDLHYPLMPANRDDYARAVEAVRATLGYGTFCALWSEGRAMTLDRAVELARAAPSPTLPATLDHVRSILTDREREVTVRVARGLTNRQIAAELVISRRTADTHVRNILRKLDCASRAEVAAWAASQGLLADTTTNTHAAYAR